jgi:hypothetical protein
MGLATIVPIWEFQTRQKGGGPALNMFSQNEQGLPGWTLEWIVWYAFATADGGGIPIYEFSQWLSGNTYYRYSTDPSVGGAWKQTGVAWYAFDAPVSNTVPIYQYSLPASGGVCYTLSANDNLGQGWVNGGIAFYALTQEKAVAPDYGLAIAAGGYVAVPSSNSYNFGTGDFSVTAMFQTVQAGTLVSRKTAKGGSPANAGWLVTVGPNGAISFATDSGRTFYAVDTNGTDALDGAWHGVAAIRRNGQLEIWLDGVQLPVTVRGHGSTPLNVNSSTRLVIGTTDQTQQPHRQFVGTIEDVTLWNCAISATEISETMFNLLTGQEQGLVGFWAMDNSLADSSPTKNTGTPTGSVSFVPVFHATWVEGAPNAFSFATISNLVVGQTSQTVVDRTQTLTVAQGAPYLVVCITYPLVMEMPEGVTLSVYDPQGRLYNQDHSSATLYAKASGSSLWYMTVVNPIPGEWVAKISAPASTPFVFWFHTLPSADLVQTMTDALEPVYGLEPGGKRDKRGLPGLVQTDDFSTRSKALGVASIVGGVALGAIGAISLVVPIVGEASAAWLVLAAGMLINVGEAQILGSNARQANLMLGQAAFQVCSTAGFTVDGEAVWPPLCDVYGSVIKAVGTPATTNPALFASRTTMGVDEHYFLHLDVWGEGPSYTDNMPAGFERALNLNAMTTKSPNSETPIPMLVLVTDVNVTQIPFADGTFDYVTIQGAPLATPIASEMARILAPGGRVGLWINWEWGDNLANAQKIAALLNSTLQFSCAGVDGTPGGVPCSAGCVDETGGRYGITKGCIVDGRKS